MKARSAVVSFHLHATEDGEKVRKVIKEMLGVEVKATEMLHGHYGNIIFDSRTPLEQEEAEALLDRVLTGLGSADRALLLRELRGHVDDRGIFFVRLDKQELLLGRLVLGGSDPVKISVKLSVKGERAEELIKGCLT
ncbi:MAG: RNA-binding domain-containing protein [Conexivisphaerales archaeon]|jgi:RNA binding exosome subunit